MNWIAKRRRDRRRRRMARGAAAGVLLLILAGAVGGFLPAEYASRAELVVVLPPESIWRVLTDLDGMPRWRSDLTALERLPDLAGRPAWREVGRSGTNVVELSVADAPHRMVIRRTRDGRPGLPERTFDLEAAPAGTRVTLTERSEIRNPFGRLLARLGVARAPVTRMLRDLDERIGTSRRQVAAEPGN